ncbi:XdhC family protein [Microbacterium amylolyticum]|uniref:Xanthine dehydrogenase accessory factor n=1 Tax=Microbacterium amylolyticum TaxID=936337 RepID=A0ABS4ZGN8_9MICO|nr:XdhC/CoxI family protein [Microbacterium amylolyticum]MBP2436447.1 xanthine dehydrogenase accessory factor [Microbacterium amylolyticum]
MLDLADHLLPRLTAGHRIVVVTVTSVARSAPRGIGASMAVTGTTEVIGSLSGGCVEGDAVALAHQVLADGVSRTARFGFDDETAHAAGLACGGQVEVVAYAVTPDMRAALERAANDLPTTIGIDLDTGGLVSGADLDEAALLRETRLVTFSGPTHRRVLAISRAPRPRIVLCGATEHAAAISRVATSAGFAVTVCDPWEILVTAERFPGADQLIVDMPHNVLPRLRDIDARTAVLVLTHDTRLDVPALAEALRLPVGFVGALGARRTVARREELLRDEHSVSADDIARIHSPLGLDLGGSSPDVVAVSVIAEILAARYGGTGSPLRAMDGPIHRDLPPRAAACSPDAAPTTRPLSAPRR